MVSVLVVDDAPFIRRWAEAILVKAGHNVYQAADGDAALAVYQAHRPDAVLLDVLMPHKDGLETLRELRAMDPAARVVMLTTEARMEVVLEARKNGVRDFVLKPCPATRLLEAIDRLVPPA